MAIPTNKLHPGQFWRSRVTLAVVGAVFLLAGGWFLPSSGLIVVVGLLVCLFGAMYRNEACLVPSNASLLETPFLLARDADILERYGMITESLKLVSQNSDSIYRKIALEHLDDVARRASAIAEGKFVFEGTETWRIVYERLLRSPGLHLYRSVAWVKNANYWQDEPGRKSMAVNFELHEAGKLNIERIVILADVLWPQDNLWPVESLRQWVHEQHVRGIWVKCVRESILAQELDLVGDIGIYGSRAVGTQELDDQSRTVRFTLDFDYAKVSAAEERWRRLAVYAESWADYLDRYEMPG